MEKAQKSEKIDLNFALLCFALKQKLLNWSGAKNLKRKKVTKKRKKRKKVKKSKKSGKSKKYRLEFRFEAKITTVKRSEKFEAKISEKIEVKFYSEIVKNMWNRSNFTLFCEKFFLSKRAHPTPKYRGDKREDRSGGDRRGGSAGGFGSSKREYYDSRGRGYSWFWSHLWCPIF